MIPLPNLVAFILASTLLILLPGPSVLFVIGRALSIGRLGALLSVLGNAVGMLVLASAVSFGLGAVIQSSLVVFTIIKLAGAAFMVYLGIQAIRHRRQLPGAASATPRSKRRTFAEGILVGVTNPKAAVFFIAVLPQFVSVHAGNVEGQLVLLAAIFVTIGLICDSTWALVASAARAWFGRSPKRIERLSTTGGVAMIGLGGVLAVTGSKS
jgi:threonine/homoserine/homoserine lactone efflux protein